MNPLNLQAVSQYVEQHIDDFHQRRIDYVEKTNLKEVLLGKNPYLFKAKNMNRPEDILRPIIDASISSSEETIFGNWLERLAIFINHSVYGGQKAASLGMDLDFTDGTTRYLVTIKSGPNWGNADAVKKMVDNFNTARRILQTSGGQTQVIFVNGCCYGRSQPNSEFKAGGNYYKKCGQRFWELISGDSNLYKELIVPLGHNAKAHNDKFQVAYNALIAKFTLELAAYADANGDIDWDKWITLNSSFPIKISKPVIQKTPRKKKGT